MIGIALARLWEDAPSRWFSVGGFVLMLPLYAMVLPASLTGGAIGLSSLRLLSPALGAVALALSVTLALTLGLMALLVRQGRAASTSAATGGILVALITPLLCCSPILPLALGALALAFPVLAGATAGWVQGFIATNEMAILTIALVLSALAFYQNARRVRDGVSCRVPDRA